MPKEITRDRDIYTNLYTDFRHFLIYLTVSDLAIKQTAISVRKAFFIQHWSVALFFDIQYIAFFFFDVYITRPHSIRNFSYLAITHPATRQIINYFHHPLSGKPFLIEKLLLFRPPFYSIMAIIFTTAIALLPFRNGFGRE